MTAESRRPKAAGGVRKRGDKWIASVEGNPDPKTGKRRRMEKTCRSEAEANIELQKLFTKVRTKADVGTSTEMTLALWLEEWVEQKERTLRPGTVRNYKKSIHYIVDECKLGKTKLSKLSKSQIASMDDKLTKNHSVDVARAAHIMLEGALQDAIRIDLLGKNVAGKDGPRPPALPKRRTDRLSVKEAAKFMAAHQDHPMIIRWMVAFIIGVRQGEALGLRWKDIDFDAGEIRIRNELELVAASHGCGEPNSAGDYPCWHKRGGNCPERHYVLPNNGRDYEKIHGSYYFAPVKSRTSNRVIPIPPILIDALREYRDRTAGDENPWDLVWHRSDGKPIMPGDDWKQWKVMLMDAGLRHVNPHSTRKTAASVLVSLGADMSMVMRILGHSDLSITEIYADVDREAIRSAMAKMGSILSDGVEVKEIAEAGSVVPLDEDQGL